MTREAQGANLTPAPSSAWSRPRAAGTKIRLRCQAPASGWTHNPANRLCVGPALQIESIPIDEG